VNASSPTFRFNEFTVARNTECLHALTTKLAYGITKMTPRQDGVIAYTPVYIYIYFLYSGSVYVISQLLGGMEVGDGFAAKWLYGGVELMSQQGVRISWLNRIFLQSLSSHQKTKCTGILLMNIISIYLSFTML
jgi:hypothetical protein